jgi:hypothetical protein
MSERIVLAATNISIGLLLGVMGYLVRERRMMHLIAGYDPLAVTDEAGLANFFGLHFYALAVLTMANGVADYLFGFQSLRWTAWTVALLAIVLRLWVGSSRYERD